MVVAGAAGCGKSSGSPDGGGGASGSAAGAKAVPAAARGARAAARAVPAAARRAKGGGGGSGGGVAACAFASTYTIVDWSGPDSNDRMTLTPPSSFHYQGDIAVLVDGGPVFPSCDPPMPACNDVARIDVSDVEAAAANADVQAAFAMTTGPRYGDIGTIGRFRIFGAQPVRRAWNDRRRRLPDARGQLHADTGRDKGVRRSAGCAGAAAAGGSRLRRRPLAPRSDRTLAFG